MKVLILAIIGLLIISYILDKKPPLPTKDGYEIIRDVNYNKTVINTEHSENIAKFLKIITELNPLKTPIIWTYVEIPNENKEIQLLYEKQGIPTFFKKCIDKLDSNSYNLIVLTPENINIYFPDFPIHMNHTSKIPFKKRVDILFAHVLYEYGGICISPGTIVYDTNELIKKLYNHDLVTVGSSPTLINGINYPNEPNSYIIGSKPRTQFSSEYKRLLLLTIKDNYNYQIKNKESHDILKDVLEKTNVNQFHFGPAYDGTYNNNQKLLSISDYLGTEMIDFLEPSKLFAVTIPYDLLINSGYEWFLNLSEKQLNQSNLTINKLIHTTSFT